jgi:hypothetical protein
MSAPERGTLLPNWLVTDPQGEKHALWDFRQKSHVILVAPPDGHSEMRDQWMAAFRQDRQKWAWLNTTLLFLEERPAEVACGLYLIDRYGRLWSYFEPQAWSLEGVEREWIYYEARHC